MYGEGSTQKKWHSPIQHLCRKRVQFMENSGCPSSPCYHHNSVSPCMSLVPSKQLSLHQSPECLKEERLYVGTLGGCLSFRQPSVSSEQMESPLVFTARCFGGFLHGTGILGWGSQSGVGNPWSSEKTCGNWVIPPVCGGPAPLTSFPLLLVLTWLLLYNLSYRTCLVFRWLSKLIVLLFTCNFDVFMRVSKCSIYLLYHLAIHSPLLPIWLMLFLICDIINKSVWLFN